MKDWCTEEEYLKPSVFKNRIFYEIEQMRKDAEEERRRKVLYAIAYALVITGAVAILFPLLLMFLEWVASLSIIVVGVSFLSVGVIVVLILQYKKSKQ